jgi:hypothetical protein
MTMCPECLANAMSDEQRKHFGCCEDCSRYLYRSWAILDRACEGGDSDKS